MRNQRVVQNFIKMILEILLAIPGLVLLWILVTYVEHLISLRKYPKGPFPLPLVGNVLLLSDKPYLDVIEMSKKYGEVFSISLGYFHISFCLLLRCPKTEIIKQQFRMVALLMIFLYLLGDFRKN